MTSKFGIRITLPEGDTMRTLLGQDWEAFRWYDSAAARDAAYEDMRNPPPYYRMGDRPSQVLEKVER